MASSIPGSVPANASAAGVTAPRSSRARRTRWLALAGGIFVLVLVVAALAAPLIAPFDPVRQSLRGRLAPPTFAGADGRAPPPGTDPPRRAVPSRAVFGARGS